MDPDVAAAATGIGVGGAVLLWMLVIIAGE